MSETAETGDEPRRLRLSTVECTNGSRDRLRPRAPRSTPRSPRRHRRLHLHEHAQGHAAEPPQPHAADAARPRPAPGAPDAAGACTSARPRRDQVGRAETVVVGGRLTWTMTVTNRSSVAAADVNGVKVDDPRSFRTRLISLQPVPGHLPAVHLRPRSPRARRLRDRDRRHRGDAGRASSSTSSESARRSRSRTTATTSQPRSPRSSGRSHRPRRNRCDTLTAEPRALQNGRSSVVRLTARNPPGSARRRCPRSGARPGCRPTWGDRPAWGSAAHRSRPDSSAWSISSEARGGSSEEARPAGRCSASSARTRRTSRASYRDDVDRRAERRESPEPRRDVVRDPDAAVRHRLPEQPRQVRAVDADDPVVRPVGHAEQ